jgi:hypothetical protein
MKDIPYKYILTIFYVLSQEEVAGFSETSLIFLSLDILLHPDDDAICLCCLNKETIINSVLIFRRSWFELWLGYRLHAKVYNGFPQSFR